MKKLIIVFILGVFLIQSCSSTKETIQTKDITVRYFQDRSPENSKNRKSDSSVNKKVSQAPVEIQSAEKVKAQSTQKEVSPEITQKKTVQQEPVSANTEEAKTKTTQIKAPETEQIPVKARSTNKNTNQVYIVAGSFENKDNAEQLVQKIKRLGYPQAFIANSGNIYRVVVAAKENAKEARDFLKLFQQKNPAFSDAWILFNK